MVGAEGVVENVGRGDVGGLLVGAEEEDDEEENAGGDDERPLAKWESHGAHQSGCSRKPLPGLCGHTPEVLKLSRLVQGMRYSGIYNF